MSKSSLTVIVPRLLERMTPGSTPAGADSCVALLAGRGDIARRWHATQVEEARLEPWQRGLLAALRLDENAHPSAPLTALGCEQTAGECGAWLHAEPIHLAAGLNEVALVPLRPELELTHQERESISPMLSDHLGAEGCRLLSCSRAWLIGVPRELEISTVTTAFAAEHEWSAVLPQGRDAPWVRRTMTELQMLLHEHPVNESRAARDKPTVNALWLWGHGRCEPDRGMRAPVCVGSNDYLRGICRRNGWPMPHEPLSVDTVLARATESESLVCVLDEMEPAAFERDWLVPFVGALKGERLGRLELILDEWLLTVDRWRLRRFWRRPLPLAAWAVA